MEKQQIRANPLRGYLSSPEVSDEDDSVNTISSENGVGQLGLFHESSGLLSDDENFGSAPALGDVSGNCHHRNSHFFIELSDDDTDDLLTAVISESSSSSSSSSFPLLPVSSISASTITLHDGLFGELLPKLPTRMHNEKKHKHFSHKGNLDFIQLLDHIHVDDPVPEAILQEINITGLRATFYSVHAMVKATDRVMFMIVGDKTNEIYTHSSEHMRSILVLTQAQYDALPIFVLSKVDILVLHEMVSATHGNYHEHLMQTSSQRIAAFIFSHHVGLKHFMMANSQIRSIGYHFHQNDKGAKSLFGLLKKRMGDTSIIAVSRNYNQEVKKSNLGTGVFMVNMAPIKAALPLPQQMYWLMPQAADAGSWAEVLYVQIFLEQLALEHEAFEGEGMAGRKMLKRKDAATKYHPSSKRQEDNQGLHSSPLPNLMVFNKALGGEDASDAHYCINQTVEEVNRIIEANWHEYQKRKHRAEEGDLFQYHWDAQRGLPQDLNPIAFSESVSNIRQGQAFVDIFKVSLREIDLSSDRFRPYQRDAIAAVAAFEGTIGHLVIPPGCGKTLLTYLLVKQAWSLVNSDEAIVVVTPQRNLLNQLFADFSMYYYRWFHDYQRTDIMFTFDRVIKVSSMTNSLSIKALVCNNPIQTNKKVLLFCLESFIRYCEQYPEKMQLFKLMILDEYHTYCKRLSNSEILNLSDTFTIGCSATPPIENPLGISKFEYPLFQAISDGFAAPVIFDYLQVDYSSEAVVDLTEYLPLLLNRYYPGYNALKRLVDIVGIAFFPTIPDCQVAAENAKKAGIKAIAIYTGSIHTLADIDKIDGGCIIFGVWSLRHGYNNPKIAYVVAAQNVKLASYLLQMTGRATRISEDPFKIAYGILFQSACQVIPEALRFSALTVQPHQAYLEQADTYYYPSNDTWKKTKNLGKIPLAIKERQRFIQFGVGNCAERLQLPPNAPVRTALALTSSSSFSSFALLPAADHIEPLPGATTLHAASSPSQSDTSDGFCPSTPHSPQSPTTQLAETIGSTDDTQDEIPFLSSSSTPTPTIHAEDYPPPVLLQARVSPSTSSCAFFSASQATQNSRKRLIPPSSTYDDYMSSPERTAGFTTMLVTQTMSLSPSRYSDDEGLYAPVDEILPSSPVLNSVSLYGPHASISLSDDMLPSSPDMHATAYRSPMYYGDYPLLITRTPSPPDSPPVIEPAPKWIRYQ